jgi:hypothetical protein
VGDKIEYRFLVGKYFGKKPHGRPGMRWGENIKFSFKEICFEEGKWMELESRSTVRQIP